MLGQEAVHQPPRGPAGEGAGDLGGGVTGCERREVEGVRPALLAGQEHRAQLRGARTGGQHGRDVGAGREPAGRHQRQVRHGRHLPQQRDQAGVVDALVHEGAPVGTGFLALHDQPVGPGGDGLAGLVGGRDGHEHLRAVPFHLGDDVGRRAAEGEAGDRDACLGEQRQLGVPVVVTTGRVAERDAVPLGLVRQLGRVGGHLLGVHSGAFGHEHVEPERLVRQFTRPGDLVTHGVGAQVAGGEKAQATGVRHGRHQLGGGPATRHRGLHDRVVEPVDDRHRSPSPGKSWSSSRSSGAAFTTVSATSSSGVDNAMIAPPTP